ncbi:unnamed protein product, partial [Prorocentrum cordatum]
AKCHMVPTVTVSRDLSGRSAAPAMAKPSARTLLAAWRRGVLRNTSPEERRTIQKAQGCCRGARGEKARRRSPQGCCHLDRRSQLGSCEAACPAWARPCRGRLALGARSRRRRGRAGWEPAADDAEASGQPPTAPRPDQASVRPHQMTFQTRSGHLRRVLAWL